MTEFIWAYTPPAPGPPIQVSPREVIKPQKKPEDARPPPTWLDLMQSMTATPLHLILLANELYGGMKPQGRWGRNQQD